MAKRRRRMSSSTASTVDDREPNWVDETELLPRLALDQENTDNWPCFVLNDAVILHKDGKRLANPLIVEKGPFIVRGRLETNSDHLEIKASWLYSIGFDPVTFWVSGLAGWFEIVPSEQYHEVYDEIREAITLYYSIMDAYEAHEQYVEEFEAAPKSKKKRMPVPKPLTVDDIFLKYAVAVGDGSLRDEVEERCHKWARFLIHHFPKELEFDWTSTLFYKWIIDEHPDIHKKLLKLLRQNPTLNPSYLEANGTPPRAPEIPRHDGLLWRRDPSRSSAVSDDVEMKDDHPASTPTAARINTRSSRSLRGSSQPEPQSPPAMPTSTAPAPVLDPTPPPQHSGRHHERASDVAVNNLIEVIQEKFDETKDPQKMTLRSTKYKVYTGCKIKDYASTMDIIAFCAEQMLPKIPQAWKSTPFYQELQLLASTPSALPPTVRLEDLDRVTSRRVKLARTASTPDVPDDKRQSGKQVGRPHAGKVASLRLVTAKKRTASDVAADEDLVSCYGRKSAKTFHPPTDIDFSYDNDDGGDDSDEDDDDDVDADDEPVLSDGDAEGTHSSKEVARVVIRAEKIPSMSPTGPNGTWICDQEGCDYVVHAAEEADGKALIKQHFHGHEAQAKRLDLAMSEGRRGHAPINHLLEKIQAAGKKAIVSERGGLDGSGLAAPIKRRLLI